MLDLAGIERERVQLRRVSAAEGALFSEYVREVSQATLEMGPFDPGKFKLQLAAMQRALGTRRVRWLTGMEYQLEKGDNVYGEKTDPELIDEVVTEAVESEYHKSLILEMLSEGPLSVREMAEKSGVSVYKVSTRLNELEREGKAEFDSHDGTTAKFATIAA